MSKSRWRAAALWVLGGLCILIGAMIAGNLDNDLGVTNTGFALALVLSFILILLGGLMWIAVSISIKRE